ncbi:DUF4080 domain-containing protein [Mycoplasma sp. P36-A1]|uniref:B12-binding domain-containing radical SAM protein n=1 Tax=Mycoplasma sp. P36-A1 TaxID=3252900 RepID=UPI003C305B57
MTNKIALVGINSKYIHPNMAIRILNNDMKLNDMHADIIEFSTKKNQNDLVDILNEFQYICFSVYIYNIKYIKDLLKKIKVSNPNAIIILGGPEVSYLSKDELDNYLADYVVCGEGEKELVKLIKSLENNIVVDNTHVISIKEKIMNKKQNMVDIKYASKLTNDFHDVNLDNQIIYLETSRGCPYKCAYCQASLDNNLRFIPLEKVKKTIKDLMDKKAKLVKLLDRTFNFNHERINEIITYIIENDNNVTTFQLEITGELLEFSTIEIINKKARKGLFRFEIGVQSTNKEANQAIYRYQDFDRLESIIRKIQESQKVVLHLDLIAGLPKENLDSFKKTFNQVFNLHPEELQLGFLKLLKGTELNNIIDENEYVFDKEAPYEIIQSKWLSKEDLKIIDNVEHSLNNYYNSNKAKEIILHLINKYNLDPFFTFSILNEHNFNINLEYNLYVMLIELQIDFDSQDRIIMYKNYYQECKTRPKPITQILNKNEVIHQLISEYEQNKKNAFKYACVEKIEDYTYFVYMLDSYKYYIVETKDR